MNRRSPLPLKRRPPTSTLYIATGVLIFAVMLYTLPEYAASYRGTSATLGSGGRKATLPFSTFSEALNNVEYLTADRGRSTPASNPADARRRWPVEPSSPRYAADALEPLMLGAAVCAEPSCAPRKRDANAPAVQSFMWASWEPSATTSVTQQFIHLVDRMYAQDDSYSEAPTQVLFADATGRLPDETPRPFRPFLDVVITHVDPAQHGWRSALAAAHNRSNVHFDLRRYRHLDELRYAMRSIYHQGASLIRRVIVLVADERHLPAWLNRSSTFVKIVTHAEVMPCASATQKTQRYALTECDNNDATLPTFNSFAIESVIHRIPGLSKFFLSFNNDMLLGRKLSFLDFFRPVLASPTHHADAVLLDVAELEQSQSLGPSEPNRWAPGNGPVVMHREGTAFFQFEPIIHSDFKGRFADCSVHNEDHGREAGSVHCFQKHPSSARHVPRQRSLWRELSRRVLRTKCNGPVETRDDNVAREMVTGERYTLSDREPDPCDFVTPDAYYDAFITGKRRELPVAENSDLKAQSHHASQAANTAIARARAWYHFGVFPWHAFARVPLLTDRDVLAFAMETDVYGIRRALQLTRRHQLRQPMSFWMTYHAQHMMLAERRAAAVQRNNLTELPLCDRAQDRGRQLQSNGNTPVQGARDNVLCLDTENDTPIGIDPGFVPREAVVQDVERASSNLALSKLFRAVIPIGSHAATYMLAHVGSVSEINQTLRLIPLIHPLFITVKDGFDTSVPEAVARRQLAVLLSAATDGLPPAIFELAEGTPSQQQLQKWGEAEQRLLVPTTTSRATRPLLGKKGGLSSNNRTADYYDLDSE